MARRNDKWRPCSPKKNRTCCHSLWNRSAITNTENAWCIWMVARSEEHTSELQSRPHLVCRLLLEKKKRSSTGTLAARRIPLIHAQASHLGRPLSQCGTHH